MTFIKILIVISFVTLFAVSMNSLKRNFGFNVGTHPAISKRYWPFKEIGIVTGLVMLALSIGLMVLFAYLP